jgi:hypothetical protein
MAGCNRCFGFTLSQSNFTASWTRECIPLLVSMEVSGGKLISLIHQLQRWACCKGNHYTLIDLKTYSYGDSSKSTMIGYQCPPSLSDWGTCNVLHILFQPKSCAYYKYQWHCREKSTKQLEGTQAKTNERGHNELLSCKVSDHYLNHEWQWVAWQ